MTLQLNRKLFTVEEYHKLAEVGILKPTDRVELINGEIINKYQITRKSFTIEEYYKLADVGILKLDDRVELINGQIITMSPINSTHAGTVTSLLESLFPILIKKTTILCQSPIIIPNVSAPEPDIVIAKYRPDSYRSAHPLPVNVHLVIEVSDSTLQYDREIKCPLYANAGISEYWIINLSDRQIEIHRQPKNGVYHFKQIISQEGLIQASSVDFSINYSDIFKPGA